jgi:peptidoglycan lytic transglycosylase
MSRFRLRRRRAARRRLLALAMPLAALAATTAAFGAPASSRTPKATLNVGATTVQYGRHFDLRGHVPGKAKHPVTIVFHARNAGRWRQVRHLRTGAAGGYDARMLARKSGTYRAIAAGARSSDLQQVRVRSRVHARLSSGGAIAGQRVAIKGRVLPATGGRSLKVTVGHDSVRTHTDGHGHFKARWTAHSLGRFHVRVAAKGDRFAAGSRDSAGHVTVFRHATASWYGPGLYGHRVACGGTLEPDTLGVANKTLPCGTKVTLRYRGNQVRVPVIDRGPYVAGRDYDLTAATKSRLGMSSGVATLLSSK